MEGVDLLANVSFTGLLLWEGVQLTSVLGLV